MRNHPATYSVPQASELLGIDRNTGYKLAREEGSLGGVPVIRLGERRLVIPRAPLNALLGIGSDHDIPSQ